MSQILTNTTFVDMMNRKNKILSSLVKRDSSSMSLSTIHSIVADGNASSIFNIGDQIIIPWSDGSITYDVPFDVVNFNDVTIKDEETLPGMGLQWHYTLPFGVQFDQCEALYYCAEALPAGTYNFTALQSWGSKSIVANTTYQFTTTKEVPIGGQLVLSTGTVDNVVNDWRIKTYSSSSSTTQLETDIPVLVGATGKSLGKWSNTQTYNNDYTVSTINHMHRSNYGYNRWSQSGLRQYLNSKEVAGSWWKEQNKFDRPPAELSSHQGFMKGFSDEFLSILKPIKVDTSVNTAEGSSGEIDITYDTFFLPSLEQEYIEPQLSGEGSAWDYWKTVKGMSKPQVKYVDTPAAIKYALNSKTSAQYTFYRSSYPWSAYGVFYVGTSGAVYYGYDAYASFRSCPACSVC